MSGDVPAAFTWWKGTKLAEIVDSGQIAPARRPVEEEDRRRRIRRVGGRAFKVNGHIYGMPTGINRLDRALQQEAVRQGRHRCPAEDLGRTDGRLRETEGSRHHPVQRPLQEGWRGFVWFEELLIRTDPDAYVALNEGKLKYTDEPVQKVFKIWTDLYSKGYFTDPASQEEQLDFARGKAAMYLAGDWNIGLVEKAGLKPGTDFGGFIMPNVEAPVPNVVIVEASPIVISYQGRRGMPT